MGWLVLQLHTLVAYRIDCFTFSDHVGPGGPRGILIEHFKGQAWSVVPSPSPGSNATLTGVTTSNAANTVRPDDAARPHPEFHKPDPCSEPAQIAVLGCRNSICHDIYRVPGTTGHLL